MRIDVITLFPEVFDALKASIPGRAQASGALTLDTYQLRRHAVNRHGQVDDAPYGGEAGMVLRPEPLRAALQAVLERAAPMVAASSVVVTPASGTRSASVAPDAGADDTGTHAADSQEQKGAVNGAANGVVNGDKIREDRSDQQGEGEGEGEGEGGGDGSASGEPGVAAPAARVNDTPGGGRNVVVPGKPHVVYMSAQGALLTQRRAATLAALPHVVIVCGHYKGVDQRFLDACVDEEISIGDYVLSGGELPAMVLIDAIARLLPGVLGDIDSADTDSHALPGRLGWPVYTRPAEFEGRGVPEVLLSGHHANIEKWRALESLRLTQDRRPDLLREHPLTEIERNLLNPPVKKRRKRSS